MRLDLSMGIGPNVAAGGGSPPPASTAWTTVTGNDKHSAAVISGTGNLHYEAGDIFAINAVRADAATSKTGAFSWAFTLSGVGGNWVIGLGTRALNLDSNNAYPGSAAADGAGFQKFNGSYYIFHDGITQGPITMSDPVTTDVITISNNTTTGVLQVLVNGVQVGANETSCSTFTSAFVGGNGPTFNGDASFSNY